MPSALPRVTSENDVMNTRDTAAEERVLFVHAHPDDETISTGGTIAILVDSGASVTVLTCTRGERGEVIPQDLAVLRDDARALARHRETELASAMHELGVVDHRYLGADGARMADRPPREYRDSGMRWGDHGAEPIGDAGADSLSAAHLGEVAADIATVIALTGATAVVSYDPTGGYGHPDHVAAQAAARHAADVMVVPFWAVQPSSRVAAPTSTSGGVREHRGTTIEVDVSPVLDRKIAALRAHRSQLTVDGHTIVMSGGQIESIATVERFHSDVESQRPSLDWTHSGMATRAMACALALVVGAAIGALATVIHQATFDAFGATVPLGLLGGLVVVALFLVGLRGAFGTRIVAASAASGVLGAIAVLALESVGGSVLIPASSDLSYPWLYGPAAIAFLVLAWPNLGGGSRVRIDPRTNPKGTATP